MMTGGGLQPRCGRRQETSASKEGWLAACVRFQVRFKDFPKTKMRDRHLFEYFILYYNRNI